MLLEEEVEEVEEEEEKEDRPLEREEREGFLDLDLDLWRRLELLTEEDLDLDLEDFCLVRVLDFFFFLLRFLSLSDLVEEEEL